MRREEIMDVRAYAVQGAGGDYHDRESGHWLIDTQIVNPLSGYSEYRASRTSWGIAVLGSIVVEVEVETRSGINVVATGLGGPPACFMSRATKSQQPNRRPPTLRRVRPR